MTDLPMGANAPLPASPFTLTVTLPDGAEIDVTALLLYPGGKVRGDGDMCFFNQPRVGGGALALETAPGQARFAVDLSKAPAEVEKIVVTATLDRGTFGAVGPLRIDVEGGPAMTVATEGRSEAALILCELYLRSGAWKIRHVGQGFNGGLKALAEHFGVEVAAEEAAPAPPPPAAASTSAIPPVPKREAPPSEAPRPPEAAPINLSKVTLTKEKRTVSLTKESGRYGKIGVNLDWNQKKAGGLFGMGARGIDLDLGAFVEGADGSKTIVQALGNMFGDYARFPHVRLLGDDRTGATQGGEWLEIDGDAWKDLKRVMVYAFIYQGVADWRETDGVVRIHVPGQPEVEVRMNEYGSSDGLCCVAILENAGGQIRVSREVRFFPGQEDLDRAYGWGFRWTAGRK